MSIFKESFKSGVKDQILRRQEALEKRTPDAVHYLNSRNAWIRMTSAVDVDGKSSLAAYHILQGGMLYNNTLRSGIGTAAQAYSNVAYGGADHKLGIRPMPGITSLEIESDSAYGSIRRATVNFNCWDIKQLEDLEILYMRPGYTVLVEWGWAPYLDNSGKLSNDIPSVNIFSKKTKEDIWKEIADKSSKNGNYDAHYGFIKNYSWSARTDGGYDCSVIIVSIGEILESLKINYNAATTEAPSKGLFGILSTPFEQNSAISTGYNQNILAGMVAEIHEIAATKNNITDKTVTPTELKGEKYNLFRFNISVAPGEETEITSPFGTSGNQIYISLRDFVKLLNKYVLLQDEKSGKPLIPLSVTDSENNDLLCLGNELQLSTDPTVCLIGNNGISADGATALKDIVAALDKTSPYWSTPYTLARIGNIYVNLEYIYKLCTDSNLAAQDKKEKNDINAYDFIKNMMNGISSAIGNVATFDLFIDPQDGVAKIIDINFTGDKEIAKRAFVLQMQNTKSIVRNYSLKSKIFPEQSTQIAIGAQAEGGALGTDSNTMSNFNKNLEDRIMPKKVIAKALQEPPDTAAKLKNVAENLKVLTDYVSNLDINSVQDWWSSQGDFNAGEATKYANALKDIINFFRTYTPDDTKNRAIIPTELSVEIDGIGGIIIGNIFKIPNDILPRGYKGGGEGSPGPRDVAYVVTGLGHSLQNNDWVTKIKGQLIILDTPLGNGNFKTAVANSSDLSKLVGPKKVIEQIINQGGPINTNANDGGGFDGGGVSEKRGKSGCSKVIKVVTQESAPGLTLSGTTPWESIKKQYPINNTKPINVYAVGSPFDSGTDFAYKMKATRQDPRKDAVDYIAIHYTAGGTNGNPIKPFSGTWETAVASADFNISRNGKIAGFKNFQKYYSWHYGTPTFSGYVNRRSIGIELESFGPVVWCPNEQNFVVPEYGYIVEQKEVAITKTYRGHNVFQTHTQAQIWALAYLLIALYNTGLIRDKAEFLKGCAGNSRYGILYPEKGLTSAPSPGIITHGTGRNSKMDTFPQGNLLQMLDDLPNLIKSNPSISINWISSTPPATNEGKLKKVTETSQGNQEVPKTPVKTEAKGNYDVTKYSDNLIYTNPKGVSTNSVAIVIGGLHYATASWMMSQVPEALKSQKAFLFIKYGENNLKAAEDTAKSLNKKISSVSGFSRGGIEAYSAISKYPFIGLIDPSLPSITEKTKNPTNARMLYNPGNWGEYPNLKKYMETLGPIMGKNATLVTIGHEKIPSLFFNQYGNSL